MPLLPKRKIHILKQTLTSTSVVDLKYLKEKNITQCYPVWRCTSHAAFQFECQALIWKLDPYTSLSVAARATSTLLSSMCRKEFSVMGMSPRPFFIQKKKRLQETGRGLDRQLGQSGSAHTSIINTLRPWNYPIGISLLLPHFPTLFPHQLVFPTLGPNAPLFFFSEFSSAFSRL